MPSLTARRCLAKVCLSSPAMSGTRSFLSVSSLSTVILLPLPTQHPTPPRTPLCALLRAWGIGTRLSTEEAGPEAFRAFGLQCPPQLLRPIAFGVGPDPLLLHPLALALQVRP